VEFAGELRDYLDDLKKLYPKQIVDKMSITLVNSHYKVLSMYDQQVNISIILQSTKYQKIDFSLRNPANMMFIIGSD